METPNPILAERGAREAGDEGAAWEFTLRDLFAGFALAGAASDDECSAENAAIYAYRAADEMLKARAKVSP